MKKTVFSIIITLLLGPGAGHIYLKKYKKGTALIIGALCLAAVFVSRMAKDIASNLTVATQAEAAKLIMDYSSSHPKAMLYLDIAFALLWSYSLIDVYYQSRTLQLSNTK